MVNILYICSIFVFVFGNLYVVCINVYKLFILIKKTMIKFG